MTEPKECWSRDDEDYSYESLCELLDANDDMEPGQTVYIGEATSPDPADFIDADDVIEQIACRGGDVGGEWAEDYPDVTPEAKAELDEFLAQWARKYCQPTFYSIKRLREYTVTADDLVEYNDDSARGDV